MSAVLLTNETELMFNLPRQRRSHLVRADARRLHVPPVRRTRRRRRAMQLLHSLRATKEEGEEITVSDSILNKKQLTLLATYSIYIYLSF